VLCVPILVAATDFPSPRGRVSDFAEVIDLAHAARITEISEELERRTGIQLAVVTIASYAPEGSIDDYAAGLFKAWGIGKAKEDNGLLLIMAASERRVRIEVGYGLEPVVTDGRAGEIIDRDILPAFRRGEYGEGLLRGASALAVLAGGQGGVAEPEPGRPFPDDLLIAALLLGGLVLVILLAHSRRHPGRHDWWNTDGTWGRPGGFGGLGGGGFGGGGFGGFGGGASGGGGAGRGW
jgi:uncharacterized protein